MFSLRNEERVERDIIEPPLGTRWLELTHSTWEGGSPTLMEKPLLDGRS
jgi:hypothetical protein